VAAELIRERYGDAPVLAFGGSGLVDVLSAHAVVLGDPAESGQVAAVVIGWDVDFDQGKLQRAAEAVWGGAPIMVTSDARSFASKDGKNAGVGGFIANGLSYITQTAYEVVGKPSTAALSVAAQRLGVEPNCILIAGDDLTLEVAMAVGGGGVGVLVTTGTHSRGDAAEAQPGFRPDLIFDDLGELADAMLLADESYPS
jgi:ribonucleotide monophosphatase NagD (HAD superfamily)